MAQTAGLEWIVLGREEGWDVVVLRRSPGGLYLSAGIHGDEPAGAEALSAWAEGAARGFLRRAPITVVPCWNPWGLAHNSRWDARGRDRNRCFDKRSPAVVARLRRLLRAESFRAGLALHEDYEATGVYLYATGRAARISAEQILAAASRGLPVETRRCVDTMPCERGIIRRERPPRGLDGLPESLWLHRSGCPAVFTLETPSEWDIRVRVAALQRGVAAFITAFSS